MEQDGRDVKIKKRQTDLTMSFRSARNTQKHGNLCTQTGILVLPVLKFTKEICISIRNARDTWR